MRNRLSLAAVMLATCLSGSPAYSQTTSLSELQDLPPAKYQDVHPDKGFSKNHWAYQTLENFSSKYGVLVGSAKSDFEGDRALTRSEAAVILVNLVGKINKDDIRLSVGERAQLDILRNELKKETQQLVGRVANLEGRVTKLEQEDDTVLRTRIGKDFKFIGAGQMKYTDTVSGGQYTANNFAIPALCPIITGKLTDNVGMYMGINAARHVARDSSSAVKTLLLDAYVSSTHIPNNTVYLGQTRVPTGVEGTKSPFSLDFIDRAQIGSYTANQRDIGVKVAGKYKYADYYLGAYNGNPYGTTDSANNNMTFASWFNFKPLANTSKFGKLVLGTGYTSGSNEGSYDVFGGYIEYKLGKFGVKSEYAIADGTYGLSMKNTGQKADGYYVTTTYDINDKWQLLGRFDQFDANRLASGNDTSIYTAGINRYAMNKKLKFQFNYAYEDIIGGSNRSKIMFLSQYVM